MQQEKAETIAIQALGWLAGNEELLPVFLGSSGATTDDMRDRVQDSGFLISILDFLTMDDAWVIEFCDTVGLTYDQPLLARQGLPGGAQINWT